MSFDNSDKSGVNRHKARECALQMLFAADLVHAEPAVLTSTYWRELGDETIDEETRSYASGLASGTLQNLSDIDEKIKSRAEHWRIERMAIVDRNVLRLAVYEFTYRDTPNTVVINEALEIARRFSSYEATQFINGILDAIKNDLEGSKGLNDAAEQASAS
ncbi:MAG: transcription antitermination factor NusB [Acidobacteria bacterium]|nr:transcription antitermination factor NusB [Acidobacteriota bacterium]